MNRNSTRAANSVENVTIDPSTFDLALEEFDFGLGQVEEGKDAVVQFGFGVREFAGLAVHFGEFLRQVGFPLVGGARVLERVGAELEAGLQARAKFGVRRLPPGLLWCSVRPAIAVIVLAKRGDQPSLDLGLQLVPLEPIREHFFAKSPINPFRHPMRRESVSPP